MNENNITTTKILEPVYTSLATDYLIMVTGEDTGSGIDANIKVRGSLKQNVDLKEPNTKENPWSFINLDANAPKQNSVNGETGFNITDNKTYQYEVNVNVISKIAVDITVNNGIFNVEVLAINNKR